MNIIRQLTKQSFWAVLSMVTVLLIGCSGMPFMGAGKVKLSGDQEVPSVTTSASGKGTITVGADKSVRAIITPSYVVATAAHIHDGAPGTNGPVIIGLTKTSGNVWSVPGGVKLTDAQYKSYQAGKL